MKKLLLSIIVCCCSQFLYGQSSRFSSLEIVKAADMVLDVNDFVKAHTVLAMNGLPVNENATDEFAKRFSKDWFEYQNNFINRLNPMNYLDKPVFTDEVSLLQVILYKRKEVLRETASIALYGDRIVIDEGKPDELLLSFSDSPVTLLGKNRLDIYHGDLVYQIKGDFHFNALKYLNFYNRWKNIHQGTPEATFLGM